jgi:hypothetical protein
LVRQCLEYGGRPTLVNRGGGLLDAFRNGADTLRDQQTGCGIQ